MSPAGNDRTGTTKGPELGEGFGDGGALPVWTGVVGAWSPPRRAHSTAAATPTITTASAQSAVSRLCRRGRGPGDVALVAVRARPGDVALAAVRAKAGCGAPGAWIGPFGAEWDRDEHLAASVFATRSIEARAAGEAKGRKAYAKSVRYRGRPAGIGSRQRSISDWSRGGTRALSSAADSGSASVATKVGRSGRGTRPVSS